MALGLALAAELLRRDWYVIGTVRSTARTELHELAEWSAGRFTIEWLNITEPDQSTALRGAVDRKGDVPIGVMSSRQGSDSLNTRAARTSVAPAGPVSVN